METAGGLVAAVLELSAGVEDGEDDLERALLRRGMLVYRNAATVVGDRDGAAVGVQGHGDVRREAVHRLVYRVVENLPDEVVQPGGTYAADVHAGTLANRLESFEDGDVFGGVVAHERSVGDGLRAHRLARTRPRGPRGCRPGADTCLRRFTSAGRPLPRGRRTADDAGGGDRGGILRGFAVRRLLDDQFGHDELDVRQSARLTHPRRRPVLH